ncbi:MATE family efflux transporter [Odoribacter lunatus]|uniref:MATE family efflux transporter n=1 Tax=Odoribacter lunatus TaxID=2941335 RepID=UPI00203BF4A9|nr:MATE family efflux transporter [Odoribacter lunatus]
MKNLERDSIDFGRMHIPSLFCKLFFPTLTGMIFNALLTIADGIFVGRGVGSDGLAAVNIIAPLFMVTTGIGLMFGIGASVVASVHLARGNVKAANINITQAFTVSLLLLLLITASVGIFHAQTIRLLGGTEVLMPYARQYLLFLLPGFPFLLLQSIGLMLIRLDGSPRYAMMCNVIPALLNLILDYLFVFPFGWGVGGAALATTLGCVAGGIMVVWYFLRRTQTLQLYRLKFSPTSLRLTVRNVGYMTKIGASAFLTEAAMSVMMLTGNYVFIGLLGEEGVAAFSIACYLFPLVFMINNAVAQSAQPIISFNHGAGNVLRVRKALRTSLLASLVCGILATTLLCFFTSPIVNLFLTPEYPAHDIAARGIPLFASCALFFALNIAFIGYYQSTERAMRATIYTLLRGIALLVPAFLILPMLWGETGAWLAIPCAEVLTLAVIAMDFAIQQQKKQTMK